MLRTPLPKQHILLTKTQNELLMSAYISLKNSVDFLTLCFEDAANNPRLQEALTTTVGNMAIIKSVLDKNFDCNVRFKSDVKNNDTMRAFEIFRLFLSLTIKDQEEMEEMFIKANKGAKIKMIQLS